MNVGAGIQTGATMMTQDDEKRLAEIRERCEKATTGPWSVWNGPEYCGGGADLCIATGDGSDDWLANMDHRFNHYPGAHSHNEESCVEPDGICPICSFGDEITAEQMATAKFIARSRADIPWLLSQLDAALAENKRLTELNGYAIERVGNAEEKEDRLRAEVERLKNYAQHEDHCDIASVREYDPDRGFHIGYGSKARWQTDKPHCTCGLDAALKGGE